MIFRGIRAHVEAENWFAVAIDFAIVVVGVFIGLQFGNWNEAQRAKAAGRVHLELIADDLDANAALFRRRGPSYAALVERAHTREAFLRGEAGPGPTNWDNLLEIFFSSGWAPTLPESNTYDQLIASGQFGLIGTSELRDDISAYYATMEDGNTYYDFQTPLRRSVRGKFESRIQTYIWDHFFSEEVYRTVGDGQIDCPPPGDMPGLADTLDDIVAALRADDRMLEDMRYAHGISVIARDLTQTDAAVSEALALKLREAAR